MTTPWQVGDIVFYPGIVWENAMTEYYVVVAETVVKEIAADGSGRYVISDDPYNVGKPLVIPAVVAFRTREDCQKYVESRCKDGDMAG